MGQKTAFAAGPVYVSSNAFSTKDIEQKIKEINAAEIINKEEEILESVLEKEEAEEVEELVDIAAAEIAAEEIAEELVELEILDNSNLIEDSESTNEEGSGDVPKIDFGDITEVVL